MKDKSLTPPKQAEFREWALSVVDDPIVRRTLLLQAQRGLLHHKILELLFYYAHDKPVDRVVQSNGEEGNPFTINIVRYGPDNTTP